MKEMVLPLLQKLQQQGSGPCCGPNGCIAETKKIDHDNKETKTDGKEDKR